MILEDKKLSDIDIQVDLIESNGFNVVVSPKTLRKNVSKSVPQINKSSMESERLFVIILGLACISIPLWYIL
mgnify:FL=1